MSEVEQIKVDKYHLESEINKLLYDFAEKHKGVHVSFKSDLIYEKSEVSFRSEIVGVDSRVIITI